jgi:hypothetical protein
LGIRSPDKGCSTYPVIFYGMWFQELPTEDMRSWNIWIRD